ncbi:DUF4129 domain-containing protein [Mucilaginibacter sp. KACC 22063]|uniref:DUF4129 domain-containing protein n=1 Tax=Mucilaginibacter sp. KACC 22063 TaxID=3025666 RepID=UPI00236711D3|nr:DUF4129 domain-containing protein [Mucilaginibacter sp. KACC 22063]WDF56059.1 DUF4129 domain-containing protein [Mucilaginibacter sp. KACC 22063]
MAASKVIIDTVATHTKPVANGVKHAVHYLLKVDTSNVNIRKFNDAALKRLLDNPAFDYYRENNIHKLSLWDRFWRWFWTMVESIMRMFSPSSGNWVSTVIWIGVGGVVIFLIIKFVLQGSGGLFSKPSAEIEGLEGLINENIHEISFDEEINNAVAAGNYRLAVRLLYLRTLKQLDDAGLINWRIEKTNAAYLRELTDTEKRQQFGTITRQFEYVWYGNFPIDGSAFNSINALFNHFKQNIK